MAKKYCPQIDGDCVREKCMMWTDQYQDGKKLPNGRCEIRDGFAAVAAWWRNHP